MSRYCIERDSNPPTLCVGGDVTHVLCTVAAKLPWTDVPSRLTNAGPSSFLCCTWQEKPQHAPRARPATHSDELLQTHVKALVVEMIVALDRFENNLFDTVQECYDDSRAVGVLDSDDFVAEWGQKNYLLVHRWMAMQGYLGVLAKRGVLSQEPWMCEGCGEFHY